MRIEMVEQQQGPTPRASEMADRMQRSLLAFGEFTVDELTQATALFLSSNLRTEQQQAGSGQWPDEAVAVAYRSIAERLQLLRYIIVGGEGPEFENDYLSCMANDFAAVHALMPVGDEAGHVVNVAVSASAALASLWQMTQPNRDDTQQYETKCETLCAILTACVGRKSEQGDLYIPLARLLLDQITMSDDPQRVMEEVANMLGQLMQMLAKQQGRPRIGRPAYEMGAELAIASMNAMLRFGGHSAAQLVCDVLVIFGDTLRQPDRPIDFDTYMCAVVSAAIHVAIAGKPGRVVERTRMETAAQAIADIISELCRTGTIPGSN